MNEKEAALQVYNNHNGTGKEVCDCHYCNIARRYLGFKEVKNAN